MSKNIAAVKIVILTEAKNPFVMSKDDFGNAHTLESGARRGRRQESQKGKTTDLSFDVYLPQPPACARVRDVAPRIQSGTTRFQQA